MSTASRKIQSYALAVCFALISTQALAIRQFGGGTVRVSAPVADNQAKITWTAPTERENGEALLSTEIKGYIIFESKNGGDFTVIAQPGSASTSFNRTIPAAKIGDVVSYKMRTVATYPCDEEDFCQSKDSEVQSKTLKAKRKARIAAPGNISAE